MSRTNNLCKLKIRSLYLNKVSSSGGFFGSFTIRIYYPTCFVHKTFCQNFVVIVTYYDTTKCLFKKACRWQLPVNLWFEQTAAFWLYILYQPSCPDSRKALKMNGCLPCGKPLSLLFLLCPAPFGETLFHCGSGEAAVPERNPSCPQRPCMALSVRREGEERAEPRKVSGQRGVSFSSSSLFVLCCILGTVHF